MAYNKFKKLEQLRKELGINDIQSAWLPTSFAPFAVSSLLLATLAEAASEPLQTEKAKSESVVAPVLKELKRNNPESMSAFSGFELTVDTKRGLNGFCDFILTAVAHKMELTSPIFCLVEAKKDNIEKGLAQCGAEMYAARLYNAKEGNPRQTMYGCVTNAFSWCFLKLDNDTLLIDTNYIPLTFAEPHKVLAVLQWILDESLKEK